MGEIDWAARLDRARELSVQIDEIICREGRMAVARELLGAHFIGPESYQEIFGVKDVGTVPPIPAGVTAELLNAECPLAKDGRKIKDTHRLVFIPSALDGAPFTINELLKLAPEAEEKCGRGRLFYCIWAGDAFANSPFTEGKWILLPMFLIPKTIDKNYAAQEAEVAKFKGAYEVPTAFEMVAGLVMNDLCVRPERSKAGDYYNLHGWCSDEQSAGRRIFVGGLGEWGLGLDCRSVAFDAGTLGRAARRNIE